MIFIIFISSFFLLLIQFGVKTYELSSSRTIISPAVREKADERVLILFRRVQKLIRQVEVLTPYLVSYARFMIERLILKVIDRCHAVLHYCSDAIRGKVLPKRGAASFFLKHMSDHKQKLGRGEL